MNEASGSKKTRAIDALDDLHGKPEAPSSPNASPSTNRTLMSVPGILCQDKTQPAVVQAGRRGMTFIQKGAWTQEPHSMKSRDIILNQEASAFGSGVRVMSGPAHLGSST